MSGAARDLFLELLRSKKENQEILQLGERLSRVPSTVPDSFFFRFVTFTAKPGSPILQQVESYRASHRFGKEASGGLAKRSKHPKITDDTLRRELANHPEVPDGSIRQYFCYVDENYEGRIAAEVEMPDRHFDTSLSKAGLKTEVHMRREQKFSLGSFTSYSKEMTRLHDDLIRKVEGEFFSGSLGKFPVNGLEMYLRSATDPESIGGFLLESHGRGRKEIKYCPKCIENLIEEFQMGNIRIIHPPIPKTPLNLMIHCPENIHKDVGEEECISLEDLNRIMKDFRSDMHLPKFEILPLSFPDSHYSSKSLWIDIGKVKR